MKRKEKLVRVEIEPGRFVKMYPKDAAKLGYKKREAPENKMLAPEENKDDFTTIEGIGAATAHKLWEAGYLTFDDLWNADVEELPARAGNAVEEWRDD